MTDNADDSQPQVSPDGKSLTFIRRGERAVMIRKNVHSGQEEVPTTGVDIDDYSWAADGKRLVLTDIPQGSQKLLVLDIRTKTVEAMVGSLGSLTDHVGTTRELVANEGPPSKCHYRLDSFGQLLNPTNSALVSGFLFTGRETEGVTGFSDFRARVYDPRLGRFLQEDGLSPFQYEYARNNPNTYVDLTGETSILTYAIKGAGLLGTTSAIYGAQHPVDCPNLNDDGDKAASALAGGVAGRVAD